MRTYILKRLIYAVLTVLGVVTLVFLLQRLSGDPTLVLLPPETPAAEVARFRSELGLDRPIYVQYGKFLWGLLHGDLGYSYRQAAPALGLVLQRVPATFRLALAGMAVALCIGIPSGIIAAIKKDTFFDRAVMAVALLGQAMPVYWMGILLILLFSVNLKWLPALGGGGLEALIMPALALGSYSSARMARLTRSNVLEVLRRDFVRTARAKGNSEFVVIIKHALRNAMIPIVTVISLEFGSLLGGSVITETVFAWPGVGRLSVDAIMGRDYPVVQAVVLVISVVFVSLNLGVDMIYGVLDPRISIASGGKRH
ncbi:MAG TPA: ABC transporter permease [Symbiobacteriaceae bacterium]|nr:ABC transporter permease [Symbiobacteriaceae bacterium]